MEGTANQNLYRCLATPYLVFDTQRDVVIASIECIRIESKSPSVSAEEVLESVLIGLPRDGQHRVVDIIIIGDA